MVVSPTVLSELALATAACSLANSLIPLVQPLFKKPLQWEKVGNRIVSPLLSIEKNLYFRSQPRRRVQSLQKETCSAIGMGVWESGHCVVRKTNTAKPRQ